MQPRPTPMNRMSRALLAHRLKAAVKGASRIQIPMVDTADVCLLHAEELRLSALRRAKLTGLAPLRALAAEARDRFIGQATLCTVVVAGFSASVALTQAGASDAVIVPVALLPGLIWLGAVWLGRRLR